MNRTWRFGVVALGVGLLAGCVERRMTIVSEPPGANVIVNGKLIGAAPVDLPSDMFVYYGDYDILLVKDGYEPLLVKQEVKAPWYEWFPIDFFSENLNPNHCKDRRVFTYQLLPPTKVPPEDLTSRARELRCRGMAIPTAPKPEPMLPAPALLQPPVVEPLPPPRTTPEPMP